MLWETYISSSLVRILECIIQSQGRPLMVEITVTCQCTLCGTVPGMAKGRGTLARLGELKILETDTASQRPTHTVQCSLQQCNLMQHSHRHVPAASARLWAVHSIRWLIICGCPYTYIFLICLQVRSSKSLDQASGLGKDSSSRKQCFIFGTILSYLHGQVVLDNSG